MFGEMDNNDEGVSTVEDVDSGTRGMDSDSATTALSTVEDDSVDVP